MDSLKIVVIDNGGQYCHRIYRTIQDVADDSLKVKILANTTPLEEIDADGMAFSGSGQSIGEGDPIGNCSIYLDEFNGPILGMCAGHQEIAKHFGGEAKPAEIPEYGKVKVFIDDNDEILKDIPREIIVWNSHNDEVTAIGPDMIVLAHSESCKYQAIRHKEKPIFGLQFHPEVQHTEHGNKMFENFVEIVKKSKS